MNDNGKNNNETKGIIDSINAMTSEDDAFFSVIEHGGGLDESFIKANKDGLRLFAIELLKATLEQKTIIDRNNAKWIDENGVSPEYIEVINLPKKDIPATEKSTRRESKLTGFSIGLFFIILLISSVVGLITIVRFFVK